MHLVLSFVVEGTNGRKTGLLWIKRRAGTTTGLLVETA